MVEGSINDPDAENKTWSVEVVIPFAAITECLKDRRAPKDGEYYRVNFSRVQWKTDIIDHSYQKRTDENGKTFPRTTGYGHRPASSTTTIRSSGASSSSLRTLPAAITRFPRTSTGNGSSANATMPSRSCWIQKGASAMTLNELKETLKTYAPNEANVSLRKDLPITVETTSRTFLLSCPSADDAYVLLLHSNGKVERVLKGPAAV